MLYPPLYTLTILGKYSTINLYYFEKGSGFDER